MKWIRYTIIVLFILGTTFYLVVLGGPIRRTFDFHGCSVSYNYFLTNNAYCNWRTAGHCETNDFVITNIKREVGKCLCDKQTREEVGSKKMLELINSDPFLTKDYENLKREYNITLDSAKTICEYEEILFEHYIIE